MNKFKIKDLGKLLKETFKDWQEYQPFRLSAVVAYFAIISLPGLLVIVVHLVGVIFGEAAVEGEISGRVSDAMGKDAAKEIENIIAQASEGEDTTLANIFGIGTLIFGSTGVFFHLQKSLNTIWKVKAEPNLGIRKLIIDRIFSLGMVLALGFLLLVSLALSSILAIVSDWVVNNLPDITIYLFYIVNYILSFVIVTLLFALMFKYLPDVEIKWRVVWVGAAVTAILFLISEIALSIYFSNVNVGSIYGSAGSMVVMMLWITYSCLILFFGASFTEVYARHYAETITPSKHAVPVNEQDNKNNKS
ncbi:MAG: YihY/virulence factor BrkB family protein [Bacteroidota bacterium]|nr:YihY/virulence factor BrkB family protein [Bacteroidota bacterium]